MLCVTKNDKALFLQTNILKFKNKSSNVENTKRLVVIDGSNVALRCIYFFKLFECSDIKIIF